MLNFSCSLALRRQGKGNQLSSSRLFCIALSAAALLCLAAASAAPAAHFYLQMELNEEFKKITSTVEATFASNAEMEFDFGSGKTKLEIRCHAEGREELFTNGTDKMTEFKLSTCSAAVAKVAAPFCIVTPNAGSVGLKTELTEFSEPLTYGDKFLNLTPSFEITGKECVLTGTYCFLAENKVEGEVFNGLFLELIFPETALKGTSIPKGCKESKFNALVGRYRITPVIGRALKVGP